MTAHTAEGDMGDIEGGLRFCIEFKTSDMRDWEPERISRFFAGIARVIAARGRNIPELIDRLDEQAQQASDLLAELDHELTRLSTSIRFAELILRHLEQFPEEEQERLHAEATDYIEQLKDRVSSASAAVGQATPPSDDVVQRDDLPGGGSAQHGADDREGVAGR